MSWQSWDKSDWSHYGRKSSWESWEDGQGWSQSQSPKTPPRKTRAEEFGSPQGSASRFSVDVPDDFCQTRDYLDTREVYGLKFPKKVQPSAWAVKHQLAGREVTSIQLHEICWQGWNNYSLRALAQGRYVSVNFARSIKEATFISFTLQKIRESKLDLDEIALAFCVQNGATVDVSEPEAQQNSVRMRRFCAHLVDVCSTFQQQDLANAQDRIRALEQELAAAKRGSGSSEPASGSKRPQEEAEQSSASDPPAKHCPVTASSQATTKWISGLKISNAKREELQQACKNACNTIRTLSEEDQEVLTQRAADFGFPVRNLTSAKPVEVLKIVMSACALAE